MTMDIEKRNVALTHQLLKKDDEIAILKKQISWLRDQLENHKIDRLEQILTEQLKLQRTHDTDPTTMSGVARIDWFAHMVLATEDELHESLSETGWKKWTPNAHINEDAAFGELRDALQFWINAAFTLKQTSPTEMAQLIYVAMLEKLEKNHKRHEAERYDKCPNCKRALDDVVLTDIRSNDGMIQEVLCVCGESLPLELSSPYLV